MKPPKRPRRITRTKQDRWARKREKAKKGQEIPCNRACETSERARMDHRQWCRWPVGPSMREKEQQQERAGEKGDEKLPGAVLSYSLRSSRATKTGETDSTVVSLSRKILSCSSPHHQDRVHRGSRGRKSRNRFSSLDNARDTTSSHFDFLRSSSLVAFWIERAPLSLSLSLFLWSWSLFRTLLSRVATLISHSRRWTGITRMTVARVTVTATDSGKRE